MSENITSHPDKSLPCCDRRRLLGALGTAATLLATPPVAGEPQAADSFPKDAPEALARLKAGNARFVAGKTRHAHESANWRKHLVDGQKPFATIFGCSDSRAPTELVFDQGFGDLFVIRVAGNVVAPDVVESISYAAHHLRTPLFVVMGHSRCGAVTAALDDILKKTKAPAEIRGLVSLIERGLKDVDLKAPYPAALAAAVEANVRRSVAHIAGQAVPRQAIKDGRVILVGAVYEIETGRVRFLT